MLVKGAIEAVENADLVPELPPLPHHFGAWDREQKRMRHRQTVHGGCLFLRVVPVELVAVSGQLVRHALFVVAFCVGHEVGPLVATVLP